MIFQLCKWHFDIDWYKFKKRWADVFQIYPNSIHFNPLQFCPSMSLLGFSVFCESSSIVLHSYFDILVNSMTIRSVLKLPKIAWPSPFNQSTLKINLLVFSLRFVCRRSGSIWTEAERSRSQKRKIVSQQLKYSVINGVSYECLRIHECLCFWAVVSNSFIQACSRNKNWQTLRTREIEVRTGDVSLLSIATILIARKFPCTFGDLMRQLQQFCSHADDWRAMLFCHVVNC